VTGPAFDLPAPPGGWSGRELVRLVDPTGTAIAWLASGTSAACVALHIRDPDGKWREVVNDLSGHGGILVDGAPTAWTLVTRDPTSCELTCATPPASLQAQVADSALWLELGVATAHTVTIGFSPASAGLAIPIAAEGDAAIEANVVTATVSNRLVLRIG
jgi:hypothetical protein